MEGTQKDKVVIITGATGSMGIVAVEQMAREGYTVIMACRNVTKAESARDKVLLQLPEAKLEIMQLDLSSQASVRAFVSALNSRRIDALFCNAGVLAHAYSLSVDGFEMDFATNFIGNALLCELVAPLMPDGAHIVNMVSLTTKFARLDSNWRQYSPAGFSRLGTYGSSKLALLYYTISLARRYPRLHVNVSDPGVVDSGMITMGRWYDPLADIFFRPFIKTPEQGVRPALRALHSNGTLLYYVGRKNNPIASRFCKSALVDVLWNQLQQILAVEA